jgi:acid phosphatase type 7
MKGLERLSTARFFFAVLLLIIAINGLLFYWYKAKADPASSPSPASLPIAFNSEGGEDLSRQQKPAQPILVGAGDIADCSSEYQANQAKATAKLLDNIEGSVFTTGDNAYPSGTDEDFENCYEPTWGRHKDRTHPTPGNHEYDTANASGYFNYFGAAAGDPSEGYYSYDLDDWHIISLNGECKEVGGCEEDSPMLRWLKEDLAANPKRCTVAYFHEPLFSSRGMHGNNPKMKPSWDILYQAGVDVVVNGHDHAYERFAPQDPNGVADSARGIREFVVGTGGAALRQIEEPRPNSEVQNDDTYGVLKLTLHATSYDWEFVPVAGQTFTDSGSESCH